ncbi:MAG: hypothetical protein GXP16_15990 [Gammaproteobacteria bacterium]|nr:hypothetical protein [Gammaproteobacteria bacterium]
MLEINDSETRHMVPRWRSLSRSLKAGEFSATASTTPSPRRIQRQLADAKAANEDLSSLGEDFKREPTIENAEELVSSAVLFNKIENEEIQLAARSILEDEFATDTLRRFANKILIGEAEEQYPELPRSEANIRVDIGNRKRLLRINPRDSRLLTETALLHVNLGQLDKANHLLKMALILAPNDRHTLRAYSRFLVHSEKSDEAVRLLSSRAITRFDPWLASTLLACQSIAGLPIRGLKAFKGLASNRNFPNQAKSELSSEIATLEFERGSKKQAANWFQKGALDPTENSVAQLEWASRKLHISREKLTIEDFSGSHEALANKFYVDGNWGDALASCECWQELELFSLRPAILGTFIAAIDRKELSRGIALADMGLLANPSDPTLHNNRAVLLAYAGKLEQAHDALANAAKGMRADPNEPTPSQSISHAATTGLIAFREDNFEKGVKNYLRAIDLAANKKEPISCLRAMTFFCKELAEIDWGIAQEILKVICELKSKYEKRHGNIPTDIKHALDNLQKDDLPLFSSERLNNALEWTGERGKMLETFFDSTDA